MTKQKNQGEIGEINAIIDLILKAQIRELKKGDVPVSEILFCENHYVLLPNYIWISIKGGTKFLVEKEKIARLASQSKKYQDGIMSSHYLELLTLLNLDKCKVSKRKKADFSIKVYDKWFHCSLKTKTKNSGRPSLMGPSKEKTCRFTVISADPDLLVKSSNKTITELFKLFKTCEPIILNDLTGILANCWGNKSPEGYQSIHNGVLKALRGSTTKNFKDMIPIPEQPGVERLLVYTLLGEDANALCLYNGRDMVLITERKDIGTFLINSAVLDQPGRIKDSFLHIEDGNLKLRVPLQIRFNISYEMINKMIFANYEIA